MVLSTHQASNLPPDACHMSFQASSAVLSGLPHQPKYSSFLIDASSSLNHNQNYIIRKSGSFVWYQVMASLEIKSGALVSLQDLRPSSPFFKQGASLRITGNEGHVDTISSDTVLGRIVNGMLTLTGLHEYSIETGLATIIDGDDILKVSTKHLRDLTFQVGSVYQFIGELLIQPDNEGVLQARVGRNVDGIDLNLYHQSLLLLRQFQTNHLNNPATM
ncbi:CST complex subunit TEN1 [Glycine max]|nr:CST complex subunit TEN1 [Glycine max]